MELEALLESAGLADAPPGPKLPHAVTTVDEDRVVEAPHPILQGKALAVFPTSRLGTGWAGYAVNSEIHAVAGTLARAARWGQLLFGVRSHAILEGPFGLPSSRYVVARVARVGAAGADQELTAADLELTSGNLGGKFEAPGPRYWGLIVYGPPGGGQDYVLRAIVTVDDILLFRPELMRDEWEAEMEFVPKELWEIPQQVMRTELFDGIDALVAAGGEEAKKAARMLSDMDAAAFGLATRAQRGAYLQTLVDSRGWFGDWTRQEAGATAMLTAAENLPEFNLMVQDLSAHGLLDDLLRSSQALGMLAAIGRKFKLTGPVSEQFLREALGAENLLPDTTDLAASLIGGGPIAEALITNPLAEAEEAAYALVRLVSDTLEFIAMLLLAPDKVLEGLAALAQLALTVSLAAHGHDESERAVDAMLDQIGEELRYAVRGLETLRNATPQAEQNAVDHLHRRLRWAVILEVASWFVGAGEAKAAVNAIGFSRRIEALGRFLGIVKRLNIPLTP